MADSSSRVTVGILGAANIANKTCRAIKKSEKLEVVAIASRDVAKAQAMIDRWGLSEAKAYGSYDELLAAPGIAAVYIPLPSAMHVEWVRKAAGAGKHILLEKPIAVTVEEAEAVVAAAEEAGVQLMDGTMWMHCERTADMAHALHQGRCGRITDISSVFCFHASPAFLANDIRLKADCDPLGALGDLGWYSVRAILWALGWQAPSSVQGHAGASFSDAGVPLHCGAVLLFPGGERATFWCGFDSALTQTLVIHGTEGTLAVDDFVIPGSEAAVSYRLSHDHCLKHYDTQVGTAVDVKTINLLQLQEQAMWETFAARVRDIKRGGQPDKHWPHIALLTQRVLCAVLDSIRQGCKEIPFAA